MLINYFYDLILIILMIKHIICFSTKIYQKTFIHNVAKETHYVYTLLCMWKLTTYTHCFAYENSLHTHTALHMETHYIHTLVFIWKLKTHTLVFIKTACFTGKHNYNWIFNYLGLTKISLLFLWMMITCKVSIYKWSFISVLYHNTGIILQIFQMTVRHPWYM